MVLSEYWRSIMEAFCAVNDYLGRHGKPQLPEDLLQLIEGYVKASGDEQPIGDVTNHVSIHISYMPNCRIT